MPWQPGQDDGRFSTEFRKRLQKHLLIGRGHAVGRDDALRTAGRARGEQDRACVVGRDAAMGFVNPSGRRRLRKLGQGQRIRGCCAIGHDRMAAVADPRQRRCEIVVVLDEDHAGTDHIDHMRQLFETCRDQRIGWRHRAIGNADMRCGKRHQSVSERACRKNCERPIARQAAVEQGLTKRADLSFGFGIGDGVPDSVFTALAEKDTGRTFGQRCGQIVP